MNVECARARVCVEREGRTGHRMASVGTGRRRRNCILFVPPENEAQAKGSAHSKLCPLVIIKRFILDTTCSALTYLCMVDPPRGVREEGRGVSARSILNSVGVRVRVRFRVSSNRMEVSSPQVLLLSLCSPPDNVDHSGIPPNKPSYKVRGATFPVAW